MSRALLPLLLVAVAVGFATNASQTAKSADTAKPADTDKPGDEYVFKLYSGGEIRGKFLNLDERPYRRYVVQTAVGGKITLPKEEVENVDRVPAHEVEYEQKLPQVADTVEGHMAMAQWCRENNLSPQQRTHLERVIELDPNHAAARRLLGYRKIKDTWYTQKAYMESVVGKVYVPGAGWLLPQEVKLREERRIRDVRQREWFRQLKRLRSQWAKSKTHIRANKAFAEIHDPYALKALIYYKDPKREPSADFRKMIVGVLGNIKSGGAVAELTNTSLYDPDNEVRLEAVYELAETKPLAAVNAYVAKLVDGDPTIINRAAIGLEFMENKSAIGPLIDALISTHLTVYREGNGGTQATFPLNGSSGFSGGGMRSGVSYKTVKRSSRNYKVLDALRKLSGIDGFNFNVSQWKAWYATVKKTETIDLRRD